MTPDEARAIPDDEIRAEIRRERMLKAFGVWTRPPYTGGFAGNLADRITGETQMKEVTDTLRIMMRRIEALLAEEGRTCASSDS